jgi:type VI secretion system protein ImpB
MASGGRPVKDISRARRNFAARARTPVAQTPQWHIVPQFSVRLTWSTQMAANSNSGQKFISRNRKPRVHITYEDPYDSNRKVELPFVMGVMADLSGNNSSVAKPDMKDRAFLDIDMDNFDKRMAAIEPGLTTRVENKLGEGGDKLGVNLKFTKMEDFSPAAVARQIPATAKLLAAREQLSNLLKYMDGKTAAEDSLKKLLADPELMAAMKSKLGSKPSDDGPAEA